MRKSKFKKRWVILGGVIVVIGIFVSVAPKPTQSMLYETKAVKVGDLQTFYQFTGLLEPVNKQIVMLNAPAEIETLEVSEGDQVSEDDVLFTTTQGIEVLAVQDGEITNLQVSKGDVVQAGTPILNVVDFEDIKVAIKIDEYDVSHVSEDDKVDVYIESLNQTVSGTIQRVSKEAMNMNGISYFDATVELDEADSLRVGVTAEIKLLDESVTDAILLPVDAIQYDESNNPYVLMSGENDTIVEKVVTLGITNGVQVQVTEGLTAEDEVLVENDIFSGIPMPGMMGR